MIFLCEYCGNTYDTIRREGLCRICGGLGIVKREGQHFTEYCSCAIGRGTRAVAAERVLELLEDALFEGVITFRKEPATKYSDERIYVTLRGEERMLDPQYTRASLALIVGMGAADAAKKDAKEPTSEAAGEAEGGKQ